MATLEKITKDWTAAEKYESEVHGKTMPAQRENDPIDVISRLDLNLRHLEYLSNRIGFLLSEVTDHIKIK